MPFIEVDGKFLGQSGAILKYISKLGGLCPSDAFEEARADMVSDSVDDLKLALVKMYYEKDEKKKEELNKEFEKNLPLKLKCFEAILKAEGSGYFAGGKLTYADIDFFNFFNNFMGKGKEEVPESLKGHPSLVEHYNRVLNDPKINAWIKKRPETEF